ncbi:hypothetical protein [uncultured Dysgonomonas sp.]|uniref:Uncharacterized protein n=1 Tax=uncultured Dysgonomonas sp. TaxID=206096 RepID=A0A212J8E4_9BACT|nr:hypothetical protein [uncultured Dysgonomonas sp.]SBV95465.1 conserved hypothetical protein [uncultured Dysgonomonas sp.]
MKEYIAESGGRYTYSDDISNLQELALSMTSIFDACSNFIISGCEVNGANISPGYVWLNGKIRRYDGCNDAVFPYYIYEINSNDPVTYANEINKRGRCNYLCTGGKSVPAKPDTITNLVPRFIEVKADYAPRFIDKFIGKYALLLDSPFSKQTVKKDLVVAGNITGEKNIESKTAISVINESTGYSLKNIVKATGGGSLGIYQNGLLVNELVINTNGSFSFFKQGVEIARIDSNGLSFANSSSQTAHIGALGIYGSNIINTADDVNTGSVNVNYSGYKEGTTRFRNFNVYNGKQAGVPILQVEGATDSVFIHGLLSVNGTGLEIKNKTYDKGNKLLQGYIDWKDKANDIIGFAGYKDTSTFDFWIRNAIGNIVLSTIGYVDIIGELKINGVNIKDTYVNKTDFTSALAKKVAVVEGKQLSTEDFTTAFKTKLNSINKGSIATPDDGFATTAELSGELNKKLSGSANLSDLADKGTARVNLNVYSKEDANSMFLKITGNLLELVTLSAEEINGLTTEQAQELKAKKQATVRENIDAEKKGVVDLRLAKTANLSDVPDKVQARKNISVYSISEVDKKLEGYLQTDAEYKGVLFTAEHRTKLEGIRSGAFASVDEYENSVAMKDGYAMVADIIKQLEKKANLLLDNYTDDQRKTICTNLKIYSKTDADTTFASVGNMFQDYIAYLAKEGKTTAQAQTILRDKLNVPSKEDVSGNYLRKDAKLTDLSLPNDDAKKLACRTIGAAYAEEYQTKLKDTGWLQMSNSGGNTDTRQLFVRQIGNMVCIQGIINTAKRDGSNQGGTVAIIPNQIDPPKYGLSTSAQSFNDDHKHNRGTTFVLRGNTRNIVLYESGHYNIDTEINFSYMT